MFHLWGGEALTSRYSCGLSTHKGVSAALFRYPLYIWKGPTSLSSAIPKKQSLGSAGAKSASTRTPALIDKDRIMSSCSTPGFPTVDAAMRCAIQSIVPEIVQPHTELGNGPSSLALATRLYKDMSFAIPELRDASNNRGLKAPFHCSATIESRVRLNTYYQANHYLTTVSFQLRGVASIGTAGRETLLSLTPLSWEVFETGLPLEDKFDSACSALSEAIGIISPRVLDAILKNGKFAQGDDPLDAIEEKLGEIAEEVETNSQAQKLVAPFFCRATLSSVAPTTHKKSRMTVSFRLRGSLEDRPGSVRMLKPSTVLMVL